jgi:hypothetical protein
MSAARGTFGGPRVKRWSPFTEVSRKYEGVIILACTCPFLLVLLAAGARKVRSCAVQRWKLCRCL